MLKLFHSQESWTLFAHAFSARCLGKMRISFPCENHRLPCLVCKKIGAWCYYLKLLIIILHVCKGPVRTTKQQQQTLLSCCDGFWWKIAAFKYEYVLKIENFIISFLPQIIDDQHSLHHSQSARFKNYTSHNCWIPEQGQLYDGDLLVARIMAFVWIALYQTTWRHI